MTEYNKMDPVTKKKWLKALRSEKYKQGKQALHNISNNTFCCLGVLCEVIGVPKHGTETTRFLGKSSDDSVVIQLYNFGGTTDSVQPPYGFCNIPDKAMDKLMVLNDEQSEDFILIAKWIEQNL